jgi:hypothetical protein
MDNAILTDAINALREALLQLPQGIAGVLNVPYHVPAPQVPQAPKFGTGDAGKLLGGLVRTAGGDLLHRFVPGFTGFLESVHEAGDALREIAGLKMAYRAARGIPPIGGGHTPGQTGTPTTPGTPAIGDLDFEQFGRSFIGVIGRSVNAFFDAARGRQFGATAAQPPGAHGGVAGVAAAATALDVQRLIAAALGRGGPHGARATRAGITPTIFQAIGPRPAPRPTFLQAMAQRVAPLAAAAAPHLGAILPPGMNFQGYLGRQLSGLFTRALNAGLFNTRGLLGGRTIQNLLGPQVAAGLANRVAALQTYVQGRAFQAMLGVNVHQAVVGGLAQFQRLIVQPRPTAPAMNWVAVGSALARGLVAVAAPAGAFLAIGKGTEALAENRLARTRWMGGVDPRAGLGLVELEMGSLSRSLRIARETGATTASLARQINVMRESWLGWDTFVTGFGNRMGSFWAGFSGVFGGLLSAVGRAGTAAMNFLDPSGWVSGQAGQWAGVVGAAAGGAFFGARIGGAFGGVPGAIVGGLLGGAGLGLAAWFNKPDEKLPPNFVDQWAAEFHHRLALGPARPLRRVPRMP